MKKAIVTGANGFLGSAVVRELLSRGVDVIAASRSFEHNDLRSSGARFVPYDISAPTTLESQIKDTDIDAFYHFAWAGSIGADRANTAMQLQNTQAAVDCLHLAKKLGCKRFVTAGSIMEYESLTAAYPQSGAMNSNANNNTIYGAAKIASRIMCLSVASDLGIEYMHGALSNAFGVGDFTSRFLNATVKKMLAGEKLEFTSAIQNYDFVYITDAARAFYLIGEKGKSFTEYPVTSGSARPLREYITELKDLLAPQLELVFGTVPFEGISLPLSRFDCSITTQDTGYKPEVSFTEGIRLLVDWQKSYEERSI